MDGILDTIIKVITEGGKDAILTLGWLFYMLERYYFYPKREKEFRDDIASFRADYQGLAEKLSTTLSSFHTILEVVKDRIGRA